jgi:hypothetical protein
MTDRTKLWNKIAVPSYNSLNPKQTQFIELFKEFSPLLTRTANSLVSIDDVPQIRNKLCALDLDCDELAFLSRTIVFYSMWCPDKEQPFDENGVWWKIGIVIDYLLSEMFGASGNRWGDDLMFDDRLQPLSLACDFEVHQGIFFRSGRPVGPANENTLDIYLGHVAETLDEERAVQMTFKDTMKSQWQPWIEALDNVP